MRYLYEYKYQGEVRTFSVTSQEDVLEQIADFEMDEPESISEVKFIEEVKPKPIIACEGCES